MRLKQVGRKEGREGEKIGGEEGREAGGGREKGGQEDRRQEVGGRRQVAGSGILAQEHSLNL